MGSRFSHENVNSSSQSARKAHHLGSAGQGAAGSSSSALSASAFLQSVQCILNELCKVTPMKRNPKPASSTEQQYPLRSSSAGVNANYSSYHGKEDSHSAMHGEVSTARGDPASSLGDVSQLVTVSHIPMQPEIMQGLADAARSSGSRDDLEFKMGQLIRMLDEVEERFRRYSEQLLIRSLALASTPKQDQMQQLRILYWPSKQCPATSDLVTERSQHSLSMNKLMIEVLLPGAHSVTYSRVAI